jgi:hypothetical protein
MFERSERSERSEFSDGHESENHRGAFSVAEAAASARWALPGCGFAAQTVARNRPFIFRNGPRPVISLSSF